jgi:hypothetical protein
VEGDVVMTPAISHVKKLLPVVAAMAAGLALGNNALAAQKTLSWSDDACRYSISIDPAKHDERRLNNTIRLLFSTTDFQAPIVPFVSNPQAIAKLDLGKFDQQCSAALKTAREIEVTPLNGIEDYRRAKIGEIEDACRFGNVKIRGLRNPSVLREYTPAQSCSHFIDALEGKSDITKVFRDAVSQQCGQNASPQKCREEQFKDAQKPDGTERMRFYLTDYSWNNCAITYSTRNANSKSLDQMRSDLEKQFRRMFTVRSKCENPG